jgi:triosephosphate isomerase
MRKQIVAGNWKMNTTPEEGVELVKNILRNIGHACTSVNYIVCPPFTHLSDVVKVARGTAIQIGAQNCSEHASGAYTGEISAEMVASLGAYFVILGHSERRQYYGETNEILRKKMEQVYANRLIPIYCVGETLAERENGKHLDVVKKQIEEVIFGLSDDQFRRLIIAYEPVWAIGTGKVATAEQAQEMHAFIRKTLKDKFLVAADKTPILYGGSVKPDNAAEIFAGEDVDGALVGGASLNAVDFLEIGQKFK